VPVRYLELDAGELYERFLHDARTGAAGADLLLSSAMDLQVKLVNDGFAEPHRSANSGALPAWARWRDEAFGFTFEPAVMVFNRRAIAGRPLPRSRAELLQMLTRDRDFWRGRIGTYDIARSSVGYLLASQDARLSSEFGALLEVIGSLEPRTELRTAVLLDRISGGELAMGYNLLGSYALTRLDAGAPLEIVYPDDYTLAVSRTAVIPARAAHREEAHRFLEYLLSVRGQRVLAARSRLPAVRPELATTSGRWGMADAGIGSLRPIALGPGLLTYLDRQKRARLLATWRDAIKPRTAPATGVP
jgi:iron(III) transport system substrate-binding protein